MAVTAPPPPQKCTGGLGLQDTKKGEHTITRNVVD